MPDPTPWPDVPFCHHGDWFGDCKEKCACGHTCEEHLYLDTCLHEELDDNGEVEKLCSCERFGDGKDQTDYRAERETAWLQNEKS